MIRGTKFKLNLDDEDDEDEDEQKPTVLPAAFVGDVLERKPAAPKAPSMPVMKNRSGFPEHKKRVPGESRFKRKQNVSAAGKIPPPRDAPPLPSSDGDSDGRARSWEEEEKSRIDVENRQRLAGMSREEIEEERRELMGSLGPAMVERLLKRADVGDGSEEVDLSKPMGWREGEEVDVVGDEVVREGEAEDDERDEVVREEEQDDPSPTAPVKSKPSKTVTFEEPSPPSPVSQNDLPSDSSIPPTQQPQPDSPPSTTIHFPQPPQPPSLDPSSSTFLTDLHTKYFPSLPSDPQKLEWMQPPSTPSPYSPSAPALSPDQIRFSFRGELIPPSLAASIPVTAGLHHHGLAPDAAGYTIPELAHLARSSYPAQRCIAFQTLGRILFRLGTGEFGYPDVEAERDAVRAGRGEVEGKGELSRGLWREVERGRVVEGLVEEGEGRGVDRGRHLSARMYATEAVWLWRRGGGRRWRAE